MPLPGGSLTAPLACALLKQETIARARNVVRIRVHSSVSEQLTGTCCLGWFQLQIFGTHVRTNGKVDVKSTLLVI